MAFRKDRREMEGYLSIEQADVDNLRKEIRAEQEALRVREVQLRGREEFNDVLERLLNSWQAADPGKGWEVCFFVDEDGHWVIVPEFLPEGIELITTRQEQEGYQRARSYSQASHTKVPFGYIVLPFSQVARKPCGKCGAVQPVISRYVQTFDSDHGDNWLDERSVLCMDCGEMTPVSTENSSMRMH